MHVGIFTYIYCINISLQFEFEFLVRIYLTLLKEREILIVKNKYQPDVESAVGNVIFPLHILALCRISPTDACHVVVTRSRHTVTETRIISAKDLQDYIQLSG